MAVLKTSIYNYKVLFHLILSTFRLLVNNHYHQREEKEHKENTNIPTHSNLGVLKGISILTSTKKHYCLHNATSLNFGSKLCLLFELKGQFLRG